MLGRLGLGVDADVHVDQVRIDRRRISAGDWIVADDAIVGGRPDRHAAASTAQLLDIGDEAVAEALSARRLG